MKRLIMMTAGLLVTSSMLAACGGGGQTGAQPSGDATAASTPEAIYKSRCMSCHGAELEGRGGPKLQGIGGKLSKEQIAGKIANGGGGMPAFRGKLKEDELEALSAWLGGK